MNALQIETDDTAPHLSIVPHPEAPHGGFTGQMYRLHSFRVLDRDGQEVGITAWIWTDADAGHGEFLGVNLRWLRGTARAIPVLGAEVDREHATIRVAYTAAEIGRARRFKIDRRLTAREKRAIYFHYQVHSTVLRRLRTVRSSAA